MRLLKSSLQMADAVDAAGTPWSREMAEVEGKSAQASSMVIPFTQDVDLIMKACDNAQMEYLGEIPEMPVDTRGVIERALSLSKIFAEAATLIELAAVAAKAKPVVVADGNQTIDRGRRFPGQTNIPSGRGQKSPHKAPALTIEERNKDSVDYNKTDEQYVSGNQPPKAGEFTMGGEPGNAIYIP